MSLINEYFELSFDYSNKYGRKTILFMQVGSFFEVYGYKEGNDVLNIKSNDDKNVNIHQTQILTFSKTCDLAIVEKSKVVLNNHKIVMAGFKDDYVEKYINKMQQIGFTIVVYVQEQTGKNITRSLSGIFSPGTCFFDNTDKTILTNNSMCIWIDKVENRILKKANQIIVGLSNIDVYTGKSNIFEYRDVYIKNNPTIYDEIERFVSIYNPIEVIIISNLNESEILNIIQYTNIQCKLLHKIVLSSEIDSYTNVDKNTFKLESYAKKCEKQIYQKEILKNMYDVNEDEIHIFMQNFYEYNVACQSFCFLLDFIQQHNPQLINKIDHPIFENTSNKLILANHSLKQLNIIDDNSHRGKYSSVLKMLNICLTPMGKREFSRQLLNPTNNTNILNDEYSITEYILGNYISIKEENYSSLNQVYDIDKIKRKIHLNKVSPKAFYDLHCTLNSIEHIHNNVEKDETIIKYLADKLPKIEDIGNYCRETKLYISTNLNMNEIHNIDNCHSFEPSIINKDVDANLDEQRNKLFYSVELLNSIKDYLSSLIGRSESKNKFKKSASNTEYVKIHETEKNNFTLQCTSRRCKLLESELPDKETLISVKSNNNEKAIKYNFKICKTQLQYNKQTSVNNVITDSQINLACKNITQIKTILKETVYNVYLKMVQSFIQFFDKLDQIIQFITHIDIIFTKASIAKKYNYCKPIINTDPEKSFVNARGLRHCIIENIQDDNLYISNDISLGCKDSINGMLLYGTNAVGKTSLIKALGISVIMAQAGLYVPCSSFEYKPYDYIFTRILGNDNLFKGLSTFAVEMYELRTILKLANSNSLILGDELCSGTEIISAISIFVSGIQYLSKMMSSFIFATHLHEIVNYDEINEIKSLSLNHLAVEYDNTSNKLIYDRKLKSGPGNSLYGLEVCKSLSLPTDFLNNAYDIRNKYYNENPSTNDYSGSILSLNTSHYNAKKIVGKCEQCKKRKATEVHHLHHQADADKSGIIKTGDLLFHKNKKANLKALCNICHQLIHH